MSNHITVDMPTKGLGDALGEKGPYINVSSVHGSDTQTVVPDLGIHSYGRRRTMPADGIAVEVGYDGEKDSVNTLGKIYTKVRDFNVVTRNLIYILPFSIVLAIPLIIFATVAADARANGVRLLGLFIWLQVMWWCLWLSKYFAQLLPLIYMKLSGFVSSGTRKYRLVIRALELPLSFLIWTVICWVTTPLITIFDHNQKKPFHWVVEFKRVLLASIAVAALFLVEKLIIQLIAINYHRRQFNARVNESKVKVGMTDALYDTSLALFPIGSPAFRNEDFSVATGIDNTKQTSSNAKIVATLAMFGENLQSTFGNITGEITSSRIKQTKAAAIHNVVIEALELKISTEALAKRIWYSLVAEGKEALEKEDIRSIMGAERQLQADEIFNLLDADQNGDISLEEMVMWVAEVARERKAIARSMHDVGEAVKVLDRFLSVVALILLAIIYAAFFDAGFAKYVLNIGSQVAAVSFAISATVQEFLGSCIFVFVKHPYDVGDRVLINDAHMIVEHISLLYTTFKRIDNNRAVQIPNIINNNNWCENISRSKAMKEQVNISVHSETSFADIEVLRAELEDFLEENKRDFHPDVEIQISECKDLKQIDLLIGVSHKVCCFL
jgi:small-conductance mechanosensitive channel